jgi:hypothetical protein
MGRGYYQDSLEGVRSTNRMVRDSNQGTANRQSWRDLQPLPSSRSRLDLQSEFSSAEYERLALGLVPQAMEDKWFIYLEEDVLYFHRSWTGICVYEVRLSKDGDKYSVIEAQVNRDPDQYTETDQSYDGSLVLFLINNLLLGKEYPFPRPADLPKNLPKGAYQHHISGTGYHEVDVEVTNSGGKSGRLRRWLRKQLTGRIGFRC